MSCHKTDSIKIWLADFWPFCISWQFPACDLPKYLFWRIYETSFFHDETHNSNSPSKYKYQVGPSGCTGSYKLHINISLKMLQKAFLLVFSIAFALLILLPAFGKFDLCICQATRILWAITVSTDAANLSKHTNTEFYLLDVFSWYAFADILETKAGLIHSPFSLPILNCLQLLVTHAITTHVKTMSAHQVMVDNFDTTVMMDVLIVFVVSTKTGN